MIADLFLTNVEQNVKPGNDNTSGDHPSSPPPAT